VRFVGRFDKRDAAGPRVAWPGARIVARFDGTQVSVELTETKGASDDTSRWDVFVDGALLAQTLVPVEGTQTYPLATGLAAGAHTVELYRRTESYYGMTQFKKFDFGAGALLAPPPAPGRRIEILGDSGSNGYGIEGAGPACPGGASAVNQNERKSWVGLAAKALGADHHNVSYSGKGVYQNLDRTDLDLFGALYQRALPDDAASAWAFADFAPDVVIVNMGNNDWDQPNAMVFDPPPAMGFRNKLDELVGFVRTKYPAAWIFCTMNPTITDFYPPGYNAYTNMKAAVKGVVDARKATDAKIEYFEFTPRALEADLTGCDYHASPAYSQTLANQIVPAIKAKTGW
jgi:lysophospholipase L1-like esterase